MIDYQQRLFAAAYNLVGATYKITGVFSQEIFNKIKIFLADSSVDKKNICTKHAPTDNELAKKQYEINSLMLNEINDIKKKKDALINRAEEVEQGG